MFRESEKFKHERILDQFTSRLHMRFALRKPRDTPFPRLKAKRSYSALSSCLPSSAKLQWFRAASPSYKCRSFKSSMRISLR